MLFERVMHFEGKGKNLDQLSKQIVAQFTAEGYETQCAAAPLGFIIQMKKAGILRDIVTADRAFTILVSGQPDDFTIHVGVGRYFRRLAVVAIEALLLTELFLVVDVPEMLYTEYVDGKIIGEIEKLVG